MLSSSCRLGACLLNSLWPTAQNPMLYMYRTLATLRSNYSISLGLHLKHYRVLCPTHTADDATQLSSWVASAVWTHASLVVTQFPVLLSYCKASIWLLRLVTVDNIMTPRLKKSSISIKIHVVEPLCSVSKLSTESVVSRRELVANVYTPPTPTSRRRFVLGFSHVSRYL